MRSMLIVVSVAVIAASAGATDLPVYCRLLQVGLEAATYQPIIEDVNMSIVEDVTLLGDIDVSMSHVEIGAVKLVSCAASVDAHGRFNVGFQRLDIELKNIAWRYGQRNWPHTSDHGNAVGNTSISFNASIDMNREQDHLFLFHLNKIDVTLGAEVHTWLTPALTKLVSFARPLVSAVVHHEAHRVLDESLDIVRNQGGCAFVRDLLEYLDFATFKFTSYEPTKVHVPLIGDVDISVNSTYIHQPTSMQCEHVGFNGQKLDARIENVPFSAGFLWSYRKPGSSFWHNQGTGSVDVVAGTSLQIDVLKPRATSLQVDLPKLDVRLKAESDAWMYNALTWAIGPLVREMLQLFGGRFMAFQIEKCLADPACPHLKNPKATSRTIPAPSHDRADVIV